MRNHLLRLVCLCSLVCLQKVTFGQDPAPPPVPKSYETVMPKPDADGATAATAETDGDGDVDEGFAQKRLQWFIEQRAYPGEHIPPGARWQALQQREALRSLSAVSPRTAGNSPHPADAFSASWNFDGPEPLSSISGRATCIAIDPGTPATMYLGTAGGGVWKTKDGGVTWNPLTDSQASLATGALAIDPLNTSVIYAGTGEPDFSADSYYGQGLLKSNDGGNTWTLIRSPFISAGATSAPDFTGIAIQPGNSSVVVVSTTSGIFRSADAGATWTKESSLDATSVIFDVSNSSVVYAGINGTYSGVSATAGVYKSTNAGVSWAPLPGAGANSLPAASTILRAAVVEDSSGTNLYAALANSGFTAPGTLYKSTDGGANWTKLSSPSTTDGFDWYRNAIGVVPNTTPNVLFAAGAGLYQSLDAGATWTSLSGVYPDQHGFAFSPDGSKVYVADDGGIYVGASPGQTAPKFSSLNATLGTMTFYPGFSIVPGQPNSALAGSQDHGLQLYGNALAWTGVAYCGDAGSAYVDPLNSHAYAHCEGGNASWNVSNSGVNGSWVSGQAGINLTTDRQPWVAAIQGDPENVAVVYTGTNHLYQSVNYAANWTAISPDLTAGNATISAIAVSPTDSNVLYTGAGDGTVEVTNNASSGAGAAWTKLSGLPNRGITKIVVMPDSPQDVYVAVGGFGTGHIFHSTSGGTSWTDISGNIPNTPVNGFLVDPVLANTIYAATDTGVYYTSNSGTTWAVFGAGLPNVVVQDIAIYPPTRQIRVITHGRGAWDITIPASNFYVSTSLVTFGNQTLGTVSAAQTVTLSNTTPSAVSIGNITIAGSFSQTNTCGSNLAPGASCTISITFAPATAGWQTGTLSVVSPSSGIINIGVVGTGVAYPVLALSTAAITFNSQPLGLTSPAQTLTLSNLGTATLTGLAVTLNGGTTSYFAQANNCGSTLAVGASCTASVTFTPQAAGTWTSNVFVSGTQQGGTQVITLAGTTVPVLNPSTTVLNFATQNVNTTSAAQTVTLTNTSAATTVTLNGISATGNFLQTNNCGTTLVAGASCVVSVTFRPTEVGSLSGQLNVGGSSNSLTVSLAGVSAGVAGVALSTAALSFGNEPVGVSSAAQTVTIFNSGTIALTSLSIQIPAGSSYGYSDTTTCGSTLAAGASCTVSVVFKPMYAQALATTLYIYDNAPTEPQLVALSGTGLASLTASAAALNFIGQNVNTTSPPQTITVTNNSPTSTATISAISIATGQASNFAQTNNCGTSLAANASCTVSVTFTPVTIGASAAQLYVYGTSNSIPIALSGTALGVPQAVLSSSTVSFGTQPLGVTGAPQTVMLTNLGSATLTGIALTLSGTNPADFAKTTTCGTSLAVGATCNVVFTFAPAATGNRTAMLSIADTASNAPQTVSLLGSGITPLTATPASLTFTTQNVGTNSLSQTVTITNNPLNPSVAFNNISVTANFTQTNTCGTNLATGATCVISVTFSPASVGSLTGTLSIGSSSGSLSVSLSGTAVAAAVTFSGSSGVFGNQPVNLRSAVQSVTLTNSGTAGLTLSGIAISGTNSSDFAETNTCTAALAVAASCTVSLTFIPGASGTRSATLSVTDNAPGSPQTLLLTGTGTVPLIAVSPAALSFASVLAGSQSSAQTVTISNSGLAQASISSIAVTGTNSAEFLETNTCGSTLSSSSTCTASVTFAPALTGAASATLSITDNSSGSPQTVPLTGTSTAPFTLSATPSSVTVSPGSTASYTIQMSAATGTPLTAAVQLGCSGAPSLAFCSVSPTSIAAGTSTQSLSVTVTTTAPTLGFLQRGPLDPQWPAISTAVLCGVFWMGFRIQRRVRWARLLLLLIAAAGTLSLLNACGSGRSGSSSAAPGTSAGTYMLTVTAQGSGYQAAQSLTLTVQ